MADVKPAEVSAILREQLSGFKTEAELQEVGTVLQVGDGIARIYGLTGVQYGELIEFDGGLQGNCIKLGRG
jgi:F-type H+/Na+-transporting ATPase subunit alpha